VLHFSRVRTFWLACWWGSQETAWDPERPTRRSWNPMSSFSTWTGQSWPVASWLHHGVLTWQAHLTLRSSTRSSPTCFPSVKLLWIIIVIWNHTAFGCAVSPDVRDAYFGSLDKAFEGFSYVGDSAMHLMGHKHGKMWDIFCYQFITVSLFSSNDKQQIYRRWGQGHSPGYVPEEALNNKRNN
jgi:hypothetical protein